MQDSPTEAAAPINDAANTAQVETPNSSESVIQVTQEGATATFSTKQKTIRTTDDNANDNEKLMLAAIPKLPDFKGVDSEMNGRALAKKVGELHGVPLNKARGLFLSLKNKGYYETEGKEEGQTQTTFRLSAFGIKYLTDNRLISVV